MHTRIDVNLPLKDLARSRAFDEGLGYRFDERYCNDDAIALVLGGNLYAMLLREPFFATFTSRRIADATTHAEVLVALDCPDRATVDAQVAKALALGATAPMPPRDHGWMYYHAYQDLDGHVWELIAYRDADGAGPDAAGSDAAGSDAAGSPAG